VIATAYTELLESAPPESPIADLLIKPFKRDRFVLAMDRGRDCRPASPLDRHGASTTLGLRTSNKKRALERT